MKVATTATFKTVGFLVELNMTESLPILRMVNCSRLAADHAKSCAKAGAKWDADDPWDSSRAAHRSLSELDNLAL